MTEIFVFTAAATDAQKHFHTIEDGVTVDEISERDAGLSRDLSDLGSRQVRCWGSIPGPGNLRSWDRMQAGHWALVYTGGGEFPFLLPVIHKARSRRTAEHLWGVDSSGKTWELMFFFGDPQAVDIDIDEVRASLGYDDDWWPQGLQYPTPERQETLLEKFGSVEAFVESASTNGTGGSQLSTTLSPEELLLGGEFAGAPATPPKARRPSAPSDPDVAGRGYLAHEQTVEKLAAHIGPTFRKGTPGINHDGAWQVDGRFCVCEVKSITSRNEVGQLQKGLGQLLHNRFKAQRHDIVDVAAFLVAEREPANSDLWRKLCQEHGVVFTWPGEFGSDVPTPSSDE